MPGATSRRRPVARSATMNSSLVVATLKRRTVLRTLPKESKMRSTIRARRCASTRRRGPSTTILRMRDPVDGNRPSSLAPDTVDELRRALAKLFTSPDDRVSVPNSASDGSFAVLDARLDQEEATSPSRDTVLRPWRGASVGRLVRAVMKLAVMYSRVKKVTSHSPLILRRIDSSFTGASKERRGSRALKRRDDRLWRDEVHRRGPLAPSRFQRVRSVRASEASEGHSPRGDRIRW